MVQYHNTHKVHGNFFAVKMFSFSEINRAKQKKREREREQGSGKMDRRLQTVYCNLRRLQFTVIFDSLNYRVSSSGTLGVDFTI